MLRAATKAPVSVTKKTSMSSWPPLVDPVYMF